MNETITRADIEAELEKLMAIFNVAEAWDTQEPADWEEHEAMVSGAEDNVEAPTSDVNSLDEEVLLVTDETVVEALGGAIQRTLDGLEAGTTVFKDGGDMTDTITAVGNYLSLSRTYEIRKNA